jgi:hypothetical protein
VNWETGNWETVAGELYYCPKCFTEPFIGILEYVITKETLKEMNMKLCLRG